ncbi:MAG TPA: hypothetical protein PLT20_14170 [Sedimentisphaerales bacterium]|nr:hypothetical protein [Sedimentisphaerales bacterium]
MASLGMQGPHDLTGDGIDSAVTRTAAGNYALGYTKDDGTFIVQYVGRSDSDVNDRLHDWTDAGFAKFKFAYATSPKAAFEKECQNFHDFGGLEKLKNDVHPDRPDGSGWKCPVCDIFD